MTEKLTDKERLLVAEQQLKEIIKRYDSYHHDEKGRHNDLKEKVEGLPTIDKIELIFKQESQRLAEGLVKKIEHRDGIAHKRMDKLEEAIAPVKEEVVKAKAGWKWAAGLIAIIVAAYEVIKGMVKT